MTISMKKLTTALGERDFAMRASSYGAQGEHSVVARAVENLPPKELDELRPHIAAALKNAVERTTKQLIDLGLVLDDPHPARVRAAHDTAGSQFHRFNRGD